MDKLPGKRINKFLAEAGLCSRREADRWLEEGRIEIDGKTAGLGDRVLESSIVKVDGKEVGRKNKHSFIIAYYKPLGVESTYDERNPRAIPHHLDYSGERVFNIGRLDLNSEGLLLLTNDGDLVNPILRSEGQHEKEYIVVFQKPLSDRQIDLLQSGVDIGDGDRGPTKPCVVERMGGNRVRMILTEGRNRQIRRMAEALGLYVVRLKRVRVMNVGLGDLKAGQWRKISSEEFKMLKSALKME